MKATVKVTFVLSDNGAGKGINRVNVRHGVRKDNLTSVLAVGHSDHRHLTDFSINRRSPGSALDIVDSDLVVPCADSDPGGIVLVQELQIRVPDRNAQVQVVVLDVLGLEDLAVGKDLLGLVTGLGSSLCWCWCWCWCCLLAVLLALLCCWPWCLFPCCWVLGESLEVPESEFLLLASCCDNVVFPRVNSHPADILSDLQYSCL